MHAVLRAGLERLLPRAAVSILASAERHWEAGRPVSRGFGPRGEGSFLLGTRLRLQVAIKRINRRRREAPFLDGPRSNADVVLGFAVRPSLVVGARAGRSRSRAYIAQASSTTLRYGAFAEYELPSVRGLDGVDVRVSADRAATAWDAPGYLPFTLEPRRDRTTVLALTLGRRGLEWGLHPVRLPRPGEADLDGPRALRLPQEPGRGDPPAGVLTPLAQPSELRRLGASQTRTPGVLL